MLSSERNASMHLDFKSHTLASINARARVPDTQTCTETHGANDGGRQAKTVAKVIFIRSAIISDYSQRLALCTPHNVSLPPSSCRGRCRGRRFAKLCEYVFLLLRRPYMHMMYILM